MDLCYQGMESNRAKAFAQVWIFGKEGAQFVTNALANGTELFALKVFWSA
jgi:hypothetical protein